jgi:hypothetical protein
MELIWTTQQPIERASAGATFTVAAGKSLTIETSPQGVEVLKAQCPAGKIWTVHVSLSVEEHDA